MPVGSLVLVLIFSLLCTGCSVAVVSYPFYFVGMCIFLVFVVAILVFCAVLHQGCTRRDKLVPGIANSRLYMALLMGYEVTYLQFVESTMKLFHCRSELASGEGPRVLSVDTEVTCFEGSHLWVFLLAAPLLLMHTLVRARDFTIRLLHCR